MLEGFRQLPVGNTALPFVRLFYGRQSRYLWEFEDGEIHHIPQGEGGEQGDALMPLLFSLGNIARCKRLQNSCRKENICSHNWMTPSLFPAPSEWDQCTPLSRNLCMCTLAFRSMRAKHRSGTRPVCDPNEPQGHRLDISAVLLQSGLNESWWADSMACYVCLRNVQDLSSDGKTPYERRFGQPFNGPIIPFGSFG